MSEPASVSVKHVAANFVEEQITHPSPANATPASPTLAEATADHASVTPEWTEQDKWCGVIRPQHGQQDVMVWQHRFEDGSYDLMMAPALNSKPGKFTRLSFKGSQQAACHFPAVAILQGGNWGWHIAWSSSSTSKPGLYYARMDGAAWVSSPPKQLSKQAADTLQLSQQGSELLIKFTMAQEPIPAVVTLSSGDEGRTWEHTAQP